MTFTNLRRKNPEKLNSENGVARECVHILLNNDQEMLEFVYKANYKGRLKGSWTHLITPSRNFVEVW